MANQPALDTAPAGAVEIAVEDEGEGMSEEVRQRILEPFFTTKPHGVGTGLGLAMVDGFVQQCGGQLLVESELGVGSRFIMRFPEVANAPHPKEASATRREPQERKRVLLVEPAPDVRLAAKRLLEALGHEVVPAAGLTDIREILSTGDGNFDAMITALTLHDGTVRDLLEGAREKIPNLPVVYVEGSPEETALESFGSGPREARLLKPLSRQSLHDGLASLLKEA
jgi:CheY-like chemotaxis protein